MRHVNRVHLIIASSRLFASLYRSLFVRCSFARNYYFEDSRVPGSPTEQLATLGFYNRFQRTQQYKHFE